MAILNIKQIKIKHLGLVTFFLVLTLAVSAPIYGAQVDKAQQLMSTALIYSKRNDHLNAIQLSEKAVAMKPYDLNLLYQRASIWGRGGYYMKAIQDLTMVIRQDELSNRLRFPSARKYRAECYVALGYMQKAVDDYKVILKRTPEAGKIWYYMAETLALMGRKDWALEAINRGMRTKSHWKSKLEILQKKIITGEKIVPHKPFSN